MSVDNLALLRRHLLAGDYEQAEKIASGLQTEPGFGFAELLRGAHHAVNARQPALMLLLLDGAERFCASTDGEVLKDRLAALSLLVASCRREKMDDQARRLNVLALELINAAEFPLTADGLTVVAQFAGSTGSYALRRRDLDWFSAIACQTTALAARCESQLVMEIFLPAMEVWMYRSTRQNLLGVVPVIFEAIYLLTLDKTEHDAFLGRFLPEWRTVAATASLNPESPQASEWVEQLLLWTIRMENKAIWRPVIQKIAEVSRFAVSKHGVPASFSVFRPLLDVGRVQLGDELKFGSGPDDASLRQLIIRIICNESVGIAEMAAHNDFSAVAGDKIEEMYHSWLRDPDYESQWRSIERFCQLLLIFWSLNRKRAARNWTPREEKLAATLLSDAERQKLSFLL